MKNKMIELKKLENQKNLICGELAALVNLNHAAISKLISENKGGSTGLILTYAIRSQFNCDFDTALSIKQHLPNYICDAYLKIISSIIGRSSAL